MGNSETRKENSVLKTIGGKPPWFKSFLECRCCILCLWSQSHFQPGLVFIEVFHHGGEGGAVIPWPVLQSNNNMTKHPYSAITHPYCNGPSRAKVFL